MYNVEADSLSRQSWAELEWKLHPDLFARIQGLWSCSVRVDLFASRHNAQVKTYYSWHHDFDAAGVDSLHHSWHWKYTIYAYPPVFLIMRVLQKILQEETSDVILILPLWPSQAWWPTLMMMLTEVPVILPHKRWITSDPSGQGTWTHSWPLLACRISGDKPYVQSIRYKFQYADHTSTAINLQAASAA
jgi:hypothetical protein